MKTTRSYGQLGWIGLVAIVMIATGVVGQAQEPAFLKHATKVEMPRVFFDFPQWASLSQFVDCVWPGDKSVKEGIYRYDVIARTLTRLDVLTNLVRNAEAHDTPGATQEVASSDSNILAVVGMGSRLSPNGEWLLWRELGSSTLHLARLDGSRDSVCAPEPAGATESLLVPDMYWMQDSRHWAVFLSDKTGKLIAQVYDVNAPDKPMVVPFSTSTGTFNLVVDNLSQGGTHSLILADHMFWSTWTFNGSHDTVKVAELGINRSARTLHTYTIQLPSHLVIHEMEISPDGKKIAWILTSRAWPGVGRDSSLQPVSRSLSSLFADKTALQKKITNAMKKFYHDGPQTESLWVSNLDGSNMQRLGERTFKWDSGPLPIPEFAGGLRWIPGRRLSFYYEESLYTLPIQ